MLFVLRWSIAVFHTPASPADWFAYCANYRNGPVHTLEVVGCGARGMG